MIGQQIIYIERYYEQLIQLKDVFRQLKKYSVPPRRHVILRTFCSLFEIAFYDFYQIFEEKS